MSSLLFQLLFLLFVIQSISFRFYNPKLTTFKIDSSNDQIHEDIKSVELKIVTFNILAPCYNKLSTAIYESNFKDMYLKRNEGICNQLMNSDADIVCLQEFWTQNNDIRQLYHDKLCSSEDTEKGYVMKELRRTSHWRSRDDGLAVFINKKRLVVQDYKNILFHDCGDRVAQLLLLALKTDNNGPLQQFLVVNTHLLFPHNLYSTNIRVREMSKILDFVESYRQRELCRSICGRSDVRIPVIIAGDYNGSPRGSVFKLMKSQNFRSAQEQYWSDNNNSSIVLLQNDNSNSSWRWTKWISHKSHLNTIIPVDHVFYSNPSDQVEEKLPALPDWTNLVYRELMQKIVDQQGPSNMRDIFALFDHDNTNFITKEQFESTIKKIGFFGDGTPSLTNEEIDALIDSADRNGDGLIDYKEFCDRFWIALENQEQPTTNINSMKNSFKRSKWLSKEINTQDNYAEFSDSDDNVTEFSLSSQPLGDLNVKSLRIFPQELEEGIWPDGYTLSDHGMVEVVFEAQVLPSDD